MKQYDGVTNGAPPSLRNALDGPVWKSAQFGKLRADRCMLATINEQVLAFPETAASPHLQLILPGVDCDFLLSRNRKRGGGFAIFTNQATNERAFIRINFQSALVRAFPA